MAKIKEIKGGVLGGIEHRGIKGYYAVIDDTTYPVREIVERPLLQRKEGDMVDVKLELRDPLDEGSGWIVSYLAPAGKKPADPLKPKGKKRAAVKMKDVPGIARKCTSPYLWLTILGDPGTKLYCVTPEMATRITKDPAWNPPQKIVLTVDEVAFIQNYDLGDHIEEKDLPPISAGGMTTGAEMMKQQKSKAVTSEQKGLDGKEPVTEISDHKAIGQETGHAASATADNVPAGGNPQPDPKPEQTPTTAETKKPMESIGETPAERMKREFAEASKARAAAKEEAAAAKATVTGTAQPGQEFKMTATITEPKEQPGGKTETTPEEEKKKNLCPRCGKALAEGFPCVSERTGAPLCKSCYDEEMGINRDEKIPSAAKGEYQTLGKYSVSLKAGINIENYESLSVMVSGEIDPNEPQQRADLIRYLDDTISLFGEGKTTKACFDRYRKRVLGTGG